MEYLLKHESKLDYSLVVRAGSVLGLLYGPCYIKE